MKTRISITISAGILLEIDRQIGPAGSRSALIEQVLSDHFRDLERRAIHQRDLELINANADFLNREAEDVLRYQADIFDILEDQAHKQ
jgi:metal-responsive CopG/Arc/MetJ family transcriptional regulator